MGNFDKNSSGFSLREFLPDKKTINNDPVLKIKDMLTKDVGSPKLPDTGINTPSLNNFYQQYLDNQKFSNILNGVNAGIQGIGTIYGIMNMQKQWNIMNKQYNLAKEQWDRTKEELDRIKQVRDTWNKKYFSKGV
jgi:hypothetical protein